MRTSNTSEHDYIDRPIVIHHVNQEARRLIASIDDEETQNLVRYTSWLQIKALEEAISVPAKLIVPSYWIVEKNKCECAECGARYRFSDAINWNFCPSCGASIQE